MKRLTIDLKKSYNDYYLEKGDTVYTRGEKPKSDYVSPYKESIYLPINDSRNITKRDCYNKLGQLEDIEEELGIDLITLFKVLGSGLYYKTDYGTIEFVNIDRLTFVEGINEYAFEKIDGCQCGTNSSNQSWWDLKREVFLLKNYGKAWALTKEELEK